MGKYIFLYLAYLQGRQVDRPCPCHIQRRSMVVFKIFNKNMFIFQPVKLCPKLFRYMTLSLKLSDFQAEETYISILEQLRQSPDLYLGEIKEARD